MDGSETNFSGWRGAVDEARKGFKANQKSLIQRFHKPVYEWRLHQRLERDASLRNAWSKGVNVFGHKWNPPSWSYIEKVADAQGDVIRIQNTLTSQRRLHAEQGDDWEEIASEQIADTAYAIRKAKQEAAKINSEFPDDPIHWRDLIGLPMPTGSTLTMQDPKIAQAQLLTAEQGAKTNG
jgi:capsid protein